MTLERVRDLLRLQTDFGGSYNRASARRILAEVKTEFGAEIATQLIIEFNLTESFGIKPDRNLQNKLHFYE